MIARLSVRFQVSTIWSSVLKRELVRTAALDAVFADTAHLTRTFRQSFGLTPSGAIAGLAKASPRGC
jgi:AraC-like DNA-binding protein